MSKLSLDKEMNIEVKVTFIAKGNDAPLSGDQYVVRLYDKDVFGDDYLGESKLNEAGEGCIIFGHKAFGNALSLEKLPDFYFVLYDNKVPVFESKVMEDVDPNYLENYQPGEGEVIDLGTYLIDVNL
ncbi:MAG: hypothetical protein JWP81_898 [Ferruginibacter sp.]|nr:hypothetical protein [Ferruginibacter sp.]